MGAAAPGAAEAHAVVKKRVIKFYAVRGCSKISPQTFGRCYICMILYAIKGPS